MLVLRKHKATNGNQTMYTIILLQFFSISISHHVLKGDHLELTIGIGPIDITFGTAIWRNWIRT